MDWCLIIKRVVQKTWFAILLYLWQHQVVLLVGVYCDHASTSIYTRIHHRVALICSKHCNRCCICFIHNFDQGLSTVTHDVECIDWDRLISSEMFANMLAYVMISMEFISLRIFSLRHIILIICGLPHWISSLHWIVVLITCLKTLYFLLLHLWGAGLSYQLPPACVSTCGVTRYVSIASRGLARHQIYQISLSMRFEILRITLNLSRWELLPPLRWSGRSYTVRSSLSDWLRLRTRCKHIWHGASLAPVLRGGSFASLMCCPLSLERGDHALMEH